MSDSLDKANGGDPLRIIESLSCVGELSETRKNRQNDRLTKGNVGDAIGSETADLQSQRKSSEGVQRESEEQSRQINWLSRVGVSIQKIHELLDVIGDGCGDRVAECRLSKRNLK